MSLEEVLKDIERDKEEKKKEIADAASRETAKIEKEREEKIQILQREYENRMREEGSRLYNSIIDKANVEARNIVRMRVQEILDQYGAKADELIKNLAKTKEYDDVLKKMIEVSRKALGPDCIVKVNTADKGRISDGNIKFEDIDPYGGVLATSRDGKIELDLRISSIRRDILERFKVRLYSMIED
ncbi:ATP synthase (subunit E) related protein [Thermoplasma acidophilum]|uniref:A-type ATP synthase subunit E n=1 Tax=Thermoplasma acidophilum (strain ATCC 25905 / DSM 1728 / JCM 9062 / NBRC 15155 / AMRC-C165) TaxID=273075 RepID=AATE_THEAC|nr:V-type ATP synthase subunit E [Thermoplasma acidophilum]Q9HM68.1 RecName: Full=V-type ATP synthase subunit E; AltName: Full=V-ATPase subunit E [Thermoplasma acidophilum DSM 1728]CAC11150.1 ATP synthase (subunit E) related protein [Thermoplasma acidophilum]